MTSNLNLTPEQAEKMAKNLRSAGTVAAVLNLVRSNPELAATTDQWDADPFMLGGQMYCDLRTGQLKPPDPYDYITKSVACLIASASAPHPLWSRFLRKSPQATRIFRRTCSGSPAIA